MPNPTFPAAGDSTLERDVMYEVCDTAAGFGSTSLVVGYISTQQYNPAEPNMEDDSDMQSGGASSQTKTADSASATLTVLRKTPDGVIYDPGQEYLRLKAEKYGPANKCFVRISEWSPDHSIRAVAYMGRTAVGWSNPGGPYTAVKTAEVSLMGSGKWSRVTNPWTVAGAVPIIGSTSPATLAAAGGGIGFIYGSGFTGATAVSVGGNTVPTTAWSVESDTRISFVAPAHAAGAVTVVVTNGTGPSTTGANAATYV